MSGPSAKQRSLDRAAARDWAQSLVNRDDWVIVDTEATDIDASGELLEICVLSPHDQVLFDTYVKPIGRVSDGARNFHGISGGKVKRAPSYPDVHDRIIAAIGGKTVISYNAEYRKRLLERTARQHGLRVPRLEWDCAMVQYAAFFGEWADWKGEYKWQKLPGAQHRALGDCRATLTLIKQMAKGQGGGAPRSKASSSSRPRGRAAARAVGKSGCGCLPGSALVLLVGVTLLLARRRVLAKRGP
jgi:DNA polymerase-3 subunit epsilon